MLRALSAALFYDFNVFATCRSITNLELLSQHPILRDYVHRLVFCRPVFLASLAQEREYVRQVTGLWYDKRLRPGPLYTGDEVAAGFRAYKAAFREQERLLSDGLLTERLGLCISRFPKLSSVFISDSVPVALNLDIRPDVNGPTLLQKQHPDVLLHTISDFLQDEQDEIRSANRHAAFVLRTLAAANVRLEELVTYDDWGPTWEFSWDSVPDGLDRLDLSSLTRLDLCLRDGSGTVGGADWSAVLCPLLVRSPALAELYLQFTGRRNSHPTIAGIWELNLPRLAVLSIEQLKLTRTAFCNFLRRHIHLRELTLQHIKESDGRWYSIFERIREHPRLEDLAIRDLDKWKLDCPVVTFSQPELPDEVTLELYDYLHGEGGWTAGLSRLWGDS